MYYMFTHINFIDFIIINEDLKNDHKRFLEKRILLFL